MTKERKIDASLYVNEDPVELNFNGIKKIWKNVSKNDVKSGTTSQKGGEVQNLANFDYEQLSISKYINTQIDFGNSGGIPPKPDCIIQ